MQLFNHGPNTRLVLAVSPSKPISKVQNGISCSRCYWILVGLPLPLPWWGFCGFLGFPGTTSSLIDHSCQARFLHGGCGSIWSQLLWHQRKAGCHGHWNGEIWEGPRHWPNWPAIQRSERKENWSNKLKPQEVYLHGSSLVATFTICLLNILVGDHQI